MDVKYKLSTYVKRFKWMHPLSKWSFSKISSYSQCHRKFKYVYIDKVKTNSKFVHSEYFIKGRYLHSRIENYLNNFTKGINSEIYDPYSHNNEDEVNVTKDLVDSWNKIYDKLMNSKEFSELNELIKNSVQIGIEYPISYQDLFNGAIDLFFVTDNKLYIIDWKSGKPGRNDFTQLCIYSFILLEELNNKGINIDSVYLKYFYIERPSYEKIIDSSLDKFYEDHHSILMKYEDIFKSLANEDGTKGLFIPNDKGWIRNNKACRFCPVKDHCDKDLDKEDSLFFQELLKKDI